MEIEAFIKKMKDIYSALISYIEESDDSNLEFESLIDVFEKYDVLQNKEETRTVFRLVSKIANNHHRTVDFFQKIEKIFQYLIKDTTLPISDFLKNQKDYSKPILLLLLKRGLIKPDQTFLNEYLQSQISLKEETFSKKKINKIQRHYLLYPGFKQYLNEQKRKEIESEIFNELNEEISPFEEKCQIGENESYICSLIRNDSVEEFITYVNRHNVSLSKEINTSLFETNTFLIEKVPTLIEYACFFGSIQIIQYLKYNNVPLTSSLWLYAVHSNNAELIHFLEENEIQPEKNSFDIVLKESIKCHHNDIANYIKDNLMNQKQVGYLNELSYKFDDCILQSLNFNFYPNEVHSIISEMRNEIGFNIYNLLFSIKKITILDVKSIGSNAFNKCSSLKEIIIPSSVISIGSNSFDGCSSLSEIKIPSSVTEIGDNAFANCSSLTEITIPSSVKKIGFRCFYKCSNLKKISILSTLDKIDEYAFAECSSLEQINIPSSVKSIGKYAFFGCSSLKEIKIPEFINSIENCTFYKCSLLREISIPSSVNSIGEYAFSECSSLVQINVPSSVKSIGNYAFFKCKELKNISLSSNLDSIGDSVFSSCSALYKISIPESVSSIGNNAFYACNSLIDLSIPNSVKTIGKYAFYECSSLGNVLLPRSLNSIGIYAFYGCSSLNEINIPNSVTSIGNQAFSPNTTIKRI